MTGADARYHEIDEAMDRQGRRPDGLIEVLHVAQRRFGHLPRDLLAYVARGLSTPLSRVYGVATFYHFFSLAPSGRHTATVCTGTACYVKRADDVLAAVERAAGVRAGAAAPDAAVSVTTVRCLGPCNQAPVVVLDGRTTTARRLDEVVAQVRRWASGAL
jgi:bidirectional [NiFe] hydrogenase diaphorase subunit